MEQEKTLPTTDLELETIETLQLTLMLLLKNSINSNVVIPKAHLNLMKNFTMNVKITNNAVHYLLTPLAQRESSNVDNEVTQ